MKTRSFCQTFLSVSVLLLWVLVLSVGFANDASADFVPDQSKQWANGIRSALKTKNVIFNPVDLATNTLPNNVHTQLETIAEDQAQIWADTILEGDYLAENDVLLESVDIVQMNSVLLGYRITYSSLALDTSECNADVDISACANGKIVESTFVAPSLDSWIRDAKHLAEFVPDETTAAHAE